ncbi:MAG: hypothetical protein ACYCPP_06725 [Nitrososphaerales archaeon]
MKRIGIPFTDILFDQQSIVQFGGSTAQTTSVLDRNLKLIITTRKERLRLRGNNIACIEDLGDDAGLAKEKLFSILYPPKPNDWFVVGIDPGERTGIAAFINQREIESLVLPTFEATLARVTELIDNAPDVRKIVKIGRGNLSLAKTIARIIEARYKDCVKINLVNENGTSVLKRRGNFSRGTKDQRAARLIAFRDGQDYN